MSIFDDHISVLANELSMDGKIMPSRIVCERAVEVIRALRLRAETAEKERDVAKTAVVTDIIDQARCLSSMIDPIMSDMYCRGWRRALETLEKSIMAGAERP